MQHDAEEVSLITELYTDRVKHLRKQIMIHEITASLACQDAVKHGVAWRDLALAWFAAEVPNLHTDPARTQLAIEELQAMVRRRTTFPGR
jgi:hypothetical protein